MENKKILVTGAAGYIGGTFAYEALKRGYRVIGLDNFSTQIKKISNYQENISQHFTFMK